MASDLNNLSAKLGTNPSPILGIEIKLSEPNLEIPMLETFLRYSFLAAALVGADNKKSRFSNVILSGFSYKNLIIPLFKSCPLAVFVFMRCPIQSAA